MTDFQNPVGSRAVGRPFALQCTQLNRHSAVTARKAETGLRRRPLSIASNIRSYARDGKGGRKELSTHRRLWRVRFSPSSQRAA